MVIRCEGQLSVVAKYSPPRSEYRVKIKAAPFNEIIEKLTPIDVKFRGIISSPSLIMDC